MENYDIYRDIAERTNGDIYIGVVGPVRTGKSTLIKQIMENMVLPNIQDAFSKQRVQDELPQSGAGRTIMTTQPHFVPNDAVEVSLMEGGSTRIRLIDCVGYMVKGALGYTEEDAPRMVRTPWADAEMPFEEAAELGTHKVINDHSTIAIVVTTDGSITEIARSAYIDAEERVIAELKQTGKPFIILLNSTHPQDADTVRLAESLQEKYATPVVSQNVLEIGHEQIDEILSAVLYEFPIVSLNVQMPEWMLALPANHWLIASMIENVMTASEDTSRMRDMPKMRDMFAENRYLMPVLDFDCNLGKGEICIPVQPQAGLYYTILSEECGVEIQGEHHLLSLLKELAAMRQEYTRVAAALKDVREKGYGLVPPTLEEMQLEEPELVKQGGRFGVRLKASAPSLHLMKVDIQTEVSPIVGTEKQSRDLVDYIMREFETDPKLLWDTDIFGKSLNDLVKEGLSGKLMKMPQDAQSKVTQMLTKIVNEGNGGMICILL